MKKTRTTYKPKAENIRKLKAFLLKINDKENANKIDSKNEHS